MSCVNGRSAAFRSTPSARAAKTEPAEGVEWKDFIFSRKGSVFALNKGLGF